MCGIFGYYLKNPDELKNRKYINRFKSDLFNRGPDSFNYNSFEERQSGFSAYCEEDNFNQSILNSLIKKYQQLGTISYTTEAIARINWNTDWEKNYDPVIIANKIIIRATFHEPQDNYKHQN